jgi:3-hydroxypropanoate dehydrogenase
MRISTDNHVERKQMTSYATGIDAATSLDGRIVLDGAAQDVLFRQARTANRFTADPVTDEQIRALYELVKWAPTAFNQQPLRVVLVRSPEARERLVPCMWEGNREKTRQVPLVAILAADLDFHEELPTQFPVFPDAKDMFFSDPVVREASARLNATLQVGYFILGVRALGLAAGPMTGFDAAAVDAQFFPDQAHRSLVVVNIGMPAPGGAWHDRLPRLPYEAVVTSC